MGSQEICWTARSIGVSIEIHDAHALRSEHGDVAIGQEEHVPGVGKDRRNVGGHEILAVAPARSPTADPVRAATILFGSLEERMARE